MIHATVFGAEKMITSRFGRFEPFAGVFTGHDVGLDAERGHKYIVNYIFARHDQFDLAANRNMQLVNFALSRCMLELPHPLLAYNVNFQSILRRPILGEIDLRSPDENTHGDDERNN